MTLAIIIGFVVGTVAGIFLGMFYFKKTIYTLILSKIAKKFYFLRLSKESC